MTNTQYLEIQEQRKKKTTQIVYRIMQASSNRSLRVSTSGRISHTRRDTRIHSL
jgi:hypothetical protein